MAAAAATLAGARYGRICPTGALRPRLLLRWGLAGLWWARTGGAASRLACLDAEPVSAAFSALPACWALSLGAGAAGVLLPEGYAGSVVCVCVKLYGLELLLWNAVMRSCAGWGGGVWRREGGREKSAGEKPVPR